MSFHWCDNLHTTVFTPRDYQVELLASAFERNTLICLGHKSSKEFIALKLLQESSRQICNRRRISLYLTCNDDTGIDSMVVMLQHLTDLKVERPKQVNEVVAKNGHQVFVLHPKLCLDAIAMGKLILEHVQLVILDDCHEMLMYKEIMPILDSFLNQALKANKMPKILGLGGPLHSPNCTWHELGAMLNKLEQSIHCKSETASDIVTVLRYYSKPIEYIVQCAPYRKEELTLTLENIIQTHKTFLNHHRYDPTEIYNTDEFLEELKDIPDPKKEPLEFLDIVLTVLHEMGPWCADRVAINLYQRIEKQKIKTPHERHYLLLCFANSALVKIHKICEDKFSETADHKQLVELYSSPKVLRLLEILRIFKPEEFRTNHTSMRRLNNDLDKLDFQKTARALEQTCQNVENLSKQQIESQSIVENLDPIVKRTSSELSTAYARTAYYAHNNHLGKTDNNNTRRSQTAAQAQGRGRRRAYTRRQMRQQNDAADNLCAILFCNNNETARALFDLLTEMSRHDMDLKYIKCQFIADREADPISEPKEAENEHRRQEEVLKRFRMHDCNVLIGTSVLEEGIDVPKCNLVVRWNTPNTYRSYVQCKGRARATPAYHIMLVAPPVPGENEQHVGQEQLNERSHRFICQLPVCNETVNEADYATTSEEEQEEEEELENINKSYNISSSKGTVKILNPEVIRYMPPKKPTFTELKALPSNEPEKLNLPAIEAVANNEVTTLSLTEIKDGEEEEEIELNKTNDVSNSLSNLNISPDKSFEVYDISAYLANLHISENNIANQIKEPQNKKNPAKNSIITKKEKRKQCFVSFSNVELSSEDVLYQNELEQMEKTTSKIVNQLAQYREIEKMLLRKCANSEPTESEHQDADQFTCCIEPYKPLSHLLTGATVDLSNAISLVNKYCSKLPSDTFTKLTALWRCAKTQRNGVELYQYTIRLPINSPLKYDIVGLPMPTNVLARRMAAFQACIELHACGELDNYLQPIGKEGFKAVEADWENFELETQDEQIVLNNIEPRPGTTKRRQYYYKRIASEFCNCRPTENTPCYLYLLDLTLQCPIPEEQNTRGRKIYPPEEAQQGFGILTLKKIPKVSAFPIFTRSGEVKVSIELSTDSIILTDKQIRCINNFVNYTFTNVLRLQKFLMLFDPDSTENCIFIVPTIKTANGKLIDWEFLNLIEQNANKMPTAVSEEERSTTEFDANKFKDAVVMPWYRNQDQPQYFYVAEICPHLTPLSCFPGENYHTFKHYYFLKYGLNIQNTKQPLLDVDHTSARLNFLTPRYVNRKGVALPTSSEETKRAKRENLEQKQILVPELCTVHPFPASLWRTAVCLPCILYRINGLLLADDIRKKVSADIGLGKQEIDDDFEWPMLDFGWSLSEVLRKSKENKVINKNKEDMEIKAKQTNKSVTEKVKNDEKNRDEKSANEIIIEGEKKLLNSNVLEIGTWSNDMADDIDSNLSYCNSEDEDEHLEYLPANVSFCDVQTRYGSPTFWDVKKSQTKKTENKTDSALLKCNDLQRNVAPAFRPTTFAYHDSDDSLDSSYGEDMNGNVWYSDDDDDDLEEDDGLMRIAFTSKNEAETLETEQDIEKRKRQLSIIQATNVNELNYQQTKNLQLGYNFSDLKSDMQAELLTSAQAFEESTAVLRKQIHASNMLVKYNEPLLLTRKEDKQIENHIFEKSSIENFNKLLPYVAAERVQEFFSFLNSENQCLTLQQLKAFNQEYVQQHKEELFTIISSGDLFDNFNDKHKLQIETVQQGMGIKKQIQLNFDTHHYNNTQTHAIVNGDTRKCGLPDCNYTVSGKRAFSFSDQPELVGHAGPSPSIILQALTMSNANDGINLERLETIGDSFLKYAITTYLYITYVNVHEGKLSHLRSKQVANLNLYRLGRRKMLGEYMIATKFEPHDNWLPPCYYVPKELEKALIEAKIPPHHWKLVDLPNIKKLSSAEICELVRQKAEQLGLFNNEENLVEHIDSSYEQVDNTENDFSCFIPYNLVTQHSIPDKSVADCVEALIGAYLIECGTRGALLFMAWLGIRVLPYERKLYDPNEPRIPGSTNPDADNMITIYGEWSAPKSPLLHHTPHAEQELQAMLEGFDEFENILGYKFHDRSYLLQAMTHASYSPNRLTDCYQRLEFLGDAVLDYLITRHLYEDPRQHSPGALTDLRSALVNNTIFASLAVRHGFHKYFRHLSPGLNEVIDRFVRIQNENGHCISEEYYLLSEEECDDAEDVEVPKALGDVFESIAGAIFLDSNMCLDTVWKVYSNMMKPEIEQFSNSVPKSPIRELLELEPETAKFGKPEKLADGRRVRVTVDVFCKGTFRGIGRNYRIAKCTAAKCALRQLKKQGLISKKD